MKVAEVDTNLLRLWARDAAQATAPGTNVELHVTAQAYELRCGGRPTLILRELR